MNLFYEPYPVTVTVSGKVIPIVTDFREYIKMLDMLKDSSLTEMEKALCLREYFITEIPDLDEAFKQLSNFVSMEGIGAAGENAVERENGQEHVSGGKKLFSFSIDYPYIISGFLRDYGIDLTSVKYLHWWKFRMLFDGLSEDTEIKQRIMYRSIELSTIKDKEERRRIQRIQRDIQLPQEALSDYDIGDVFA